MALKCLRSEETRQYTRLSAGSTPPSCSTSGCYEREIDLTEAIEGTASAYPL